MDEVPKFEIPKSVKKWTDEEIRIATKNLLQDKTCDNCRHIIYCQSANNKYNTCYKHEPKPSPDVNDIFNIVRMGYPNTIKNELMSAQPMETQRGTIFYLKPVKNTLFRRIINKVKSIYK